MSLVLTLTFVFNIVRLDRMRESHAAIADTGIRNHAILETS